MRQAGFRPLGLVLGVSTYHVGTQYRRWNANQELDVLSQAMHHARELATTHMQAEAAALETEGIVGVQLLQHNHSCSGDVTEFFAVGTAVRPIRDDHTIPTPQLVLGLDS